VAPRIGATSHRRRPVRTRTFRTSPWTRAPILLLRTPAVFLAVVAASAVLAIAASSGVLYLSTLGTASLQAQASSACPEASMPAFSGTTDGSSAAGVADMAVAAMRTTQTSTRPFATQLAPVTVQNTTVTLLQS
jgi:hypothetical protein